MGNKNKIADLKKFCSLSGRFLLIVSLLLLPFMSVEAGHAAVALIYFAADGHDGLVVLTWETASELNNVGFFIRRSLERDRGYLRVSEFIPTHGDDLLGGVYDYVDTDVTNGVTYWYKLESIDDNQGPYLHSPPVSAVPGPPTIATQTATQVLPTTTPTTTPTNLPQLTDLPTRTSTLIPANTSVLPIQGTATVTPMQILSSPTQPISGQIGITQQVTSTATLIPVPEIAMEFPSAPVSGQENLSDPDAAQAVIDAESSQSNNSPTPQLALIGGILLFWLVLGGFLVYSIRRLR